MLPLSNYYNIGSESYFLNVPLFNYKVIFKYSYFIIPSILLCSLRHSLYYLIGNVFWRFSFFSKSAFYCKAQYIQLPFFSSFSRQKGMVWLLNPCNQISLSFFCFFLQALMSRAQQKPPREQHHPGLYNVLLLPPELHKCSSLTKSFLPMFLFIFPSFPVLPIHLFLSPILTILVLQVCCMYPLKQWFLYRRAWNFLNATGAVHEWGWVLLDPSSIDSFWEFRVPTTEPTINLL